MVVNLLSVIISEGQLRLPRKSKNRAQEQEQERGTPPCSRGPSGYSSENRRAFVLTSLEKINQNKNIQQPYYGDAHLAPIVRCWAARRFTQSAFRQVRAASGGSSPT
jgi:hypothetical protein